MKSVYFWLYVNEPSYRDNIKKTRWILHIFFCLRTRYIQIIASFFSFFFFFSMNVISLWISGKSHLSCADTMSRIKCIENRNPPVCYSFFVFRATDSTRTSFIFHGVVSRADRNPTAFEKCSKNARFVEILRHESKTRLVVCVSTLVCRRESTRFAQFPGKFARHDTIHVWKIFLMYTSLRKNRTHIVIIITISTAQLQGSTNTCNMSLESAIA